MKIGEYSHAQHSLIRRCEGHIQEVVKLPVTSDKDAFVKVQLQSVLDEIKEYHANYREWAKRYQ